MLMSSYPMLIIVCAIKSVAGGSSLPLLSPSFQNQHAKIYKINIRCSLIYLSGLSSGNHIQHSSILYAGH